MEVDLSLVEDLPEKVKIIDDFLPLNVFEELKYSIIDNRLPDFPWYFQGQVAVKNVSKVQPWNWYQTHVLYLDNHVRSDHYNKIADIFLPRLEGLKSLIRIKANFYPNTEIIREHLPHTDYDFTHTAAIFSLNTCDGFTRMEDGTKVDSVANRIVFFDGSLPHNSSTTTTSSARWNINFNYL